MKRLIITVLLLAGTVAPVRAQTGRNGIEGLSFVSPLRISGGFDNNFLVDRTTPLESLFFLSLSPSVQPFIPEFGPQKASDRMFLLALPTTGYVNDSIRRRFSATYQPEFEILMKNSDLNSMNHDARIEFSYSLTRRLEFSLGDSFRKSKDPTRTAQDSFLLLPRNEFTYNALRAAVDFDHSPSTSVSLQYDNTVTTYGETDPFQVRVLDAMGNGLTLSFNRMLRQNQRMRAIYSVFTIKEMNGPGIADDDVDTDRIGFTRPAHAVSGEYSIVLNPLTVLDLLGGVVNSDVGTNYVFGASLGRRIQNIWTHFSYRRAIAFYGNTLSEFANGVSANSYYEVFQFGGRGQPWRRVGLEFATVGSRGASGAADALVSIVARGRLDYRMSDSLVAFMQMENYRQNENVYVREPLSRTRLFTGIEYSFSPEQDRRTSRLNRDAEYVTLTSTIPRRRASRK